MYELETSLAFDKIKLEYEPTTDWWSSHSVASCVLVCEGFA